MSVSKVLGGLVIAAGCCVTGTAPAQADPDAVGADPNPYGGLRCDCREAAPAGGADQRGEIERGIREGLSVRVLGLPGP